ncbi:MAG: cysteine--tRNA ligase [Bacteroidales bacterium]|nr:cysteine--tRNA ligase [Bacteroidales bacterium]MCF8352590.1 cysteine--tRNA ligase [Bacteroidales bacterium]MCF8376848.1 cysteine--tRNA ligase [Bacteroidales bacterium]MCF8400755.1 cysteine--tRNA ligase [Bacteroidales bacterium]
MENKLHITNSLSGKKELFEPINPPHVGMYVCGPTAYGDAHLGHARPAVCFDLIYRYMQHLGYQVRYVRNITDVGHLEHDADEGEDKVAKKARLEKLEPMEVVQYYVNRYHQNMDALNVLRPSIEPHASGHIIEQIELVKKIQEKGFAYETNGSLYFDIKKYSKDHHYGILSGRRLEDLMSETRQLEGQGEKKSSYDFAVWKKAQPEHIMRWPSPWSDGFPGWHAECSAMGVKYLGEEFDIHGGGMDLLFPHHEAEIAQSTVAYGKSPVKYWLHNNMVTINGKKMGKSLGNAISLFDIFSGENKLMEKAYSPMTIRFFILQAHYRSTLDFSNEALQAAEKGLKRLMQAMQTLEKLEVGNSSDFNIQGLESKCYEAMNDDFNSPVLISHLFEGVRIINSVNDKKASLSTTDLESLKQMMKVFTLEILGLQEEDTDGQDELISYLMDTLLDIRQNARKNKDFATSDKIRDDLAKLNISIKDSKEGSSWEFEK